MVEIYDADGKRVLMVPKRDPIDRPAILGKNEFERLKQQAHVSRILNILIQSVSQNHIRIETLKSNCLRFFVRIVF